MTAVRDTARLARLLSARRLGARPLRTVLTAAGVAAGVALLFSITLLNTQLADSVRSTGSMVTGPRVLQVSAASPGGLPATLATDLARHPGVEAVAPLLIDRTTISSGSRRAGVFVIGGTADIATVAPETLRELEIESDGSQTSGLVVSHRLASRLSLDVGDRVAVETPAGVSDMPVAAVFSSPLLDRVNSGMAAAMRLEEAQQVFGQRDRVDQIMLSADPTTSVATLRSDLSRQLAGTAIVGRPGGDTSAASADLDAFLLSTQMAALIVLFVAAVLVSNTMTMATGEHRTEIALARSLGATRRQLLFSALTEAALLGAAGTAVGLVAGGVLARAVLPLATYAYEGVSPVDAPTDLDIRFGPLLISAVAGIVVAVAGAVLPARRASRAVPVDALRPNTAYEWRDPSRPSRSLVVALTGAVLFTIGSVLGYRLASTELDPVLIGITIVSMFGGVVMLLPTAVPLAAGVLAAAMTRLSPTTGRLAGDTLRINPRRTTFTVAALALPLAAVVAISAAFGAGLTKFDRVAHALITAPLTVEANSFTGYTASQPLAASAQPVLEAVPGVRAALAGQNTFISLPDDSQGVLFAIPLTAAERAGVPEMVSDDQLSDEPTAFRRGLADGRIAASRLAARNLSLDVGSTLTLPTQRGPHAFTVAALYEDWSMRSTFYIDRDTYTALWGDHGAARYAIVPTPGTSLAELRERLQDAVVDAGLAAQVRTRDEAIDELLSGLTNIFGIAQGIELATLVCAALALANTAFTTIAERRWTFGLQRALGMTRKQLTRSLGLEALAIGLIGSVAGVVIGLGLGAVMTQAMATVSSSHLTHPIPWNALAASLVLGAGIAALATHYPRRTALRLSIIESLRYE